MFFRKMNEQESNNWRNGAIFGFYTYLFVLGINQVYALLFTSQLFSLTTIFWSGLIAAFGCEFILNLKAKRKSDKLLIGGLTCFVLYNAKISPEQEELSRKIVDYFEDVIIRDRYYEINYLN